MSALRLLAYSHFATGHVTVCVAGFFASRWPRVTMTSTMPGPVVFPPTNPFAGSAEAFAVGSFTYSPVSYEPRSSAPEVDLATNPFAAGPQPMRAPGSASVAVSGCIYATGGDSSEASGRAVAEAGPEWIYDCVDAADPVEPAGMGLLPGQRLQLDDADDEYERHRRERLRAMVVPSTATQRRAASAPPPVLVQVPLYPAASRQPVPQPIYHEIELSRTRPAHAAHAGPRDRSPSLPARPPSHFESLRAAFGAENDIITSAEFASLIARVEDRAMSGTLSDAEFAKMLTYVEVHFGSGRTDELRDHINAIRLVDDDGRALATRAKHRRPRCSIGNDGAPGCRSRARSPGTGCPAPSRAQPVLKGGGVSQFEAYARKMRDHDGVKAMDGAALIREFHLESRARGISGSKLQSKRSTQR